MNIEAGKYYETRAGCKAAQVDVQREEYGPIRTVTRRLIVPGVYGRIYVHGLDRVERKRLCIQLSEFTVSHPMHALSSEELREAAHLFDQLAEVLEENK